MKKIDKEFLISYWQVAADGIWEEARKLPVAPQPKDVQELLKWISLAGEDIAIEAFFGDKLSENFGFFGVRISSLPKEDQMLFVQELFNAIAPTDNFEAFELKFKNTLEKFISDKSDFNILDQSPDFLELGAEGFWKSYGSYMVWKKGDVNSKSINDIERDAPQLLRPFKRAIMMEHAYQKPMPMWLAAPVSRKTKDGFIFDEQIYSSLIEASVSSL